MLPWKVVPHGIVEEMPAAIEMAMQAGIVPPAAIVVVMTATHAVYVVVARVREPTAAI